MSLHTFVFLFSMPLGTLGVSEQGALASFISTTGVDLSVSDDSSGESNAAVSASTAGNFCETSIRCAPKNPGDVFTPLTRPSLHIQTSGNLLNEATFDAIVNSVSPEFQSAASDSGINKACYELLKDKEEAPPIRYSQDPFLALNKAFPTYGDVLYSELSKVQAEKYQQKVSRGSLKSIVHALAPDMSRRPKRLPSGLTSEEAKAVLVAVYFRALWQATALGAKDIGFSALGAGVFGNNILDVREAFVLAYDAYVASMISAQLKIAHVYMTVFDFRATNPGADETPCNELWEKTKEDMVAWMHAVQGPVDDRKGLEMKLKKALVEGLAGEDQMQLSNVPRVRTTSQLTALLGLLGDPEVLLSDAPYPVRTASELGTLLEVLKKAEKVDKSVAAKFLNADKAVQNEALQDPETSESQLFDKLREVLDQLEPKPFSYKSFNKSPPPRPRCWIT